MLRKGLMSTGKLTGMIRRRFMAGSAASFAFSQTAAEAPKRPGVLRAGDLVGLAAPSTPVIDPDVLAQVEHAMKYFGLRYRFGKNVGKRSAAGDVQARVNDLHEFFADPEVRAVFCIRGGYGASQLLPYLDYGLIARNPKIFLGYSDITALHLAIHKKTGLVTFHGPVVLSSFTEYTQKHFKRALFQTDPIGVVTNPPDTGAVRAAHSLRAIRGGKARGRLIGGNLSLLAATMGTPYEVDARGRIYFLEDVEEQAYTVDRMLTQQKLGGKLDAAAGIIWGECADCGPRDYKPSFASPFTVGEVVQNILGSLRVPVLSGLTIGHTSDQLTLPIGCMASLDPEKGELTIEEAGVV
jgi:muramoyltetrapeptide carboxypeptidase